MAGLPTTSVARAVADTARDLRSLQNVRAIVAESVQRGRTDISRLQRELDEGGPAVSALFRQALAEVAAGSRSAPEADLGRILHRTGLPAPERNTDLRGEDGAWLARPDACWPHRALVVEVDSREWHLNPAAWESTMRRHNRLQAAGYRVLHFPPSRLRQDPSAVAAEIVASFRAPMPAAS